MKRSLVCASILVLGGMITGNAEDNQVASSLQETNQRLASSSGLILPQRKTLEVGNGTNVTLTVDRSGLGQPSNAEEFSRVKYYWNAGLVVNVWIIETAEDRVDAGSARIEMDKNQIALSYAMQPIKWPEGAAIPLSVTPVHLEFVARNMTRTNCTIIVKRRE